MSLRETLSRYPRTSKGVAVVFVILAIGYVYLEVRTPSATYANNPKAFFSVDDGKTWFVDSSANVPPFDKDGKQAVAAFVYRCSSGGADFVGYLQRFTPQAKAALEQAQSKDAASQTAADGAALHDVYTTGREVKRPGDAQWVSGANRVAAGQITMVKCPSGDDPAIPVEP